MNREDWLIEISHRPQPHNPQLVGRDPSNPYYDFLYYLAGEFQPQRTVELGTYNGFSTVHLAVGWPHGLITTVDVELWPDTRNRLASFENIEAIEGDSIDKTLVAQIKQNGPIDLLFIDTLHEKEHVQKELSAYLPLVKNGGIIVFDDLRMNDGMSEFWSDLTLDKLNLNHLHDSGFGVAFAP